MQRHAARLRGPLLPDRFRCLGAMLFLAVVGLSGAAQAEEPPITSLQDAACRAEAKAKVFAVPDPLNLGLREIGKQLYFGCMKRSPHAAHHSKKKRRHRRR
ncbi:hypothetical protein [Methylobacterium brachythecii]|uniref:3',5'-cyclic-nucleotide phosphodiesterase n=1 Tax=Methylobacterium brachythecii TaxID=1176177 RepID=A0A7W6F8M5_9HYPH|nr:hypothetical protein [Methylobacterium brachythecii]MBB3904623.1 hypothetical protein [Methylobacterium brachythecii]GLS45031.1 hypothetical protein GCM10007884_30200 [Methylobacterium brachythecii]